MAGKTAESLPPATAPSAADRGLPAPKDADKINQAVAARSKNDKTPPQSGAMTAKTETKEPSVAVKPAGQIGKTAQSQTAKETSPAKEAVSFAYSVQAGAFGNEKNAVGKVAKSSFEFITY